MRDREAVLSKEEATEGGRKAMVKLADKHKRWQEAEQDRHKPSKALAAGW